jgi:molecular chaperone GrpE
MSREFDDLTEDDVELVSPEKGEPAAPAAASAEVEKLSKALEQKAKEAAEAHDRYLRTYADFENYRKRMQRDLADFKKYANEQMARELLSVVDHLALAIKHAADAGDTSQGLRQGVELVYKQLRDVLEKFGITTFPAQGEAFDPAKHDAVMQEVTDAVPENMVVQVFQEGYLYHDKVLRHAKVSVSKKPQSEAKDEEKTNKDV